MLIVCLALILGGGGSSSPISETAFQLGTAMIALAMAGQAAMAGSDQAFASRIPKGMWLLASLVLMLPVLQLIPLPPALWQALPGRETETAALELVGAGRRWMPWSMAPSRTLASLLAMIPAVFLMILVAALNYRERRAVLATVCIVALASVLLGTLQLAGGESARWHLYAQTHIGFLTGFQANRNAQADVLHIAMMATAALIASLERTSRAAAIKAGLAGLWLLFGLSVLLTGSRMGIALLAVSVPVSLIIMRDDLGRLRHLVSKGWLALAAAALGAMLIAAIQLPAFARIAERFAIVDTTRQELWQDTMHAIGRVMPMGSGMGSFIPVFLPSESLEFVDPSLPARAHNDWLEFLLEGGIAGYLVLVAVAIVLARGISFHVRQRLAVRKTRAATGQLLFSSGTLAIIALHSGVDYPLRSISIACLAAVAAAIVFAPHKGAADDSINSPH